MSSQSLEITKSEKIILTSLLNFGPQKMRELKILTSLDQKELEQILESLIEKEVVIHDPQKQMYYPSVPIGKIIDLLSSFQQETIDKRKYQSQLSQEFVKQGKESLSSFINLLESHWKEFDNNSKNLLADFKKVVENKEQEQQKSISESLFANIQSFEEQLAQFKQAIEKQLENKTSEINKHSTKIIKNVEFISEETKNKINNSYKEFEEKLSSIIETTTDDITKLQTDVIGVLKQVESNFLTLIDTFFEGSTSLSTDFKEHLLKELQKFYQKNLSLISEEKDSLISLVDPKIGDITGKVIEKAQHDVDEIISSGLAEVSKKTNEIIANNANKLISEFSHFIESATELLREQDGSLDLIQTKLSGFSPEQKLQLLSSKFVRQFRQDLEINLKEMESNFRKIENEFVSSFNQLRQHVNQHLEELASDFNNLVQDYKTLLDKEITRKNNDSVKLTTISNSIEQILSNLLISIPQQASTFKTSMKDVVANFNDEIEKSFNLTTKEISSDINNLLSRSQNKIDSITADNLATSTQIITNLSEKVDETTQKVINLKENYIERAKRRFDQRAKVMKAELDNIAKNYQTFIQNIKKSIDDQTTVLSTDGINALNNAESELINSVSKIMNQIDNSLTREKSEITNLTTKVQENFERHLTRALKTIQQTFDELNKSLKKDTNDQISKLLELFDEHRELLDSHLNEFSNTTSGTFEELRTSISQSVKERQEDINNFVSTATDDSDKLIEAHRQNIINYEKKSTKDILSFLTEIEADTLSEQKSLRESLDELSGQYQGYFDSTYNIVTTIFKELKNSENKINNSLDSAIKSSSKLANQINANIEGYFTDSLQDIQNQINITVGWVTSTIDNSTREIQEEIEIIKKESTDSTDNISSSLTKLVDEQKEQISAKMNKITDELSNTIQQELRLHKETNDKIEHNIKKLTEDFSSDVKNHLIKSQEELVNSLNDLKNSLKSIIENLDVTVTTNAEESIARISNVLAIKEKDTDIFGLSTIKQKFEETNRQLKNAIIDVVQEEIIKIEQRITEISNQFETFYKTNDDEISKHIENFQSLMKHSGNTLTGMLHSKISQYIETLNTSVDLSKPLESMSQESKETHQKVKKQLTQVIVEQISQISELIEESQKKNEETNESIITTLINNNNKLNDALRELADEINNFTSKMIKETTNYLGEKLIELQNQFETLELEDKSNANQLLQKTIDNFEEQTITFQKEINSFFEEAAADLSRINDLLKELEEGYRQNLPDDRLRLIKIDNISNLESLILKFIEEAKKEVYVVIPDITTLHNDIFEDIPSFKKLTLITNVTTTKKLEKWKHGLPSKINISIRQMKTPFTGTLVVRDLSEALLLPKEVGFVTDDEEYLKYFDSLVKYFKKISKLVPRKTTE